MTVHCPHCLTGYLLPEHLLGADGARVRCPACEGVFVVLPEGEGAGRRPARGSAAVADPAPGAASGSGPSGTGAPAASGDPAAAAASVASDPARHAQPPPVEEPAAVACAVLRVLADFLGEDLARSRERGTVLSDHGPAILAGWDEYRRRLGPEAPTSAFRAALREHCGVDLTGATAN